jgi:hypothetical protein
VPDGERRLAAADHGDVERADGRVSRDGSIEGEKGDS